VHTRVKICGITRAEDGVAAVESGTDAIGLVFYKKSLRYVGIEQATKIIQSIPAFVTVVGLFVNETRENIEKIIDQVPLDLLQYHGDETPEQCRAIRKPYIKAVKVMDPTSVQKACALYIDAKAILLDVYSQTSHGGTGLTFDWSLVPNGMTKEMQPNRKLILAGGLNSENVEQAIHSVQPYAVDVSSGVEQHPGLKDRNKMKEFIARVMNVDSGRI